MASEEPFKEIPIIDFGPFLNGSTEDQQRVADEIGHACHHVGFYYLKNHGVPQDLIDRAFAQSKRFFEMPMEDKMKLKKVEQYNMKGYIPPFEERTSRLGDYKETFDFVKELPPDDEYLQMEGADDYSGNVWPDNLPGFRETLDDEYMDIAINLCDKIMESYALALKLPKDWFKPMTRKPVFFVRLLYYPARLPNMDPEHLSCGAHTDQLGITLLAQRDDVSGLQVQNSKGDWIDAIPIPGTFVVNIGDLIERWSNGYFKATMHRVVLQPGKERYSLIAFQMPDRHAKIECCMQGEVPKYPPITAGHYRRMRENFYHGSVEEWCDNAQSIHKAEQKAMNV